MSFAHSHQINFLPNVPRTLSANRTRRRVAHTAAKIGESLFFSVERETDCQARGLLNFTENLSNEGTSIHCPQIELHDVQE
eukprot:30989-Pelagococcus_subviridis.AAC.15